MIDEHGSIYSFVHLHFSISLFRFRFINLALFTENHREERTFLGKHRAGQVTSPLASVANRSTIGTASFNPLGNVLDSLLPTALDSIAGSAAFNVLALQSLSEKEKLKKLFGHVGSKQAQLPQPSGGVCFFCVALT